MLALLILLGWVVYLFFNIRGAKSSVGSERTLAANRGNLPQDEEIEGARIEMLQFFGVVMLLVVGIGLPFYWLKEPGRQAGAEQGRIEKYIERGEEAFLESCAACHGADGGGGAAPQIAAVPLTNEDGSLQLDSDGNVVVFNVNTAWKAPALNSIMSRFSRDEVEEIVTFGRANTPMPPWGLAGGGAFNEQEVSDILDYFEYIQIPAEELLAANTEALDTAAANAASAGVDFDQGEWLFGAQCARCHTPGWSQAQLDGEDTVKLPVGEPGGGAFGPRLTVEGLARQFLLPQEQIDFITKGSGRNAAYGERGNGSGRMPGYGEILTAEQITSIVVYERGLNPGDPSENTGSSARPDLANDSTEDGEE
ncbi:MAG: cytochrome c [Acidimicrobiales bacterium]